MKACIHVPTGRLILACSSSDAGALLASGVSSGFSAEDLEVRAVTPEEMAALVAHNAALDEAARPAAVRRAERYQAEVDPLVAVWSGYVAEGAAEKAAVLAAEIAAAKQAIREALPD